MTGSAYFTREQGLTDEHIAHPYQADDSLVDAVRNLDKGSLDPNVAGASASSTVRR